MRLSSRFRWPLTPNRLARARDGVSDTAEVLDLTLSNPTTAGLPYPEDEIRDALNGPGTLRYELSARGALEARRAVAEYHRSRGASVEPGQVFLTASTSEAYAFLFKLLTDPGDAVLVPRPSYPLLEFLCAMEGIEPVYYALSRRERRWHLDVASLARACTGRTRAVVLVNPNNPTGSFVKRAELEEVLAVCRERGLAIIADEVFADYPLREEPDRVATLAGAGDAPTFCLGGLSKTVGLPQIKLGWIVLSGPEAERGAAAAGLELVADTYLSVASPAQVAAPSLLAMRSRIQRPILRRLRSNLDHLRRASRAAPVSVPDVEAGWYAVLELPAGLDEEAWAVELLERDHVLVQPGFLYDFEFEPVVVISLLTPEEVFRPGVDRMLASLGNPPA